MTGPRLSACSHPQAAANWLRVQWYAIILLRAIICSRVPVLEPA